IPPAISIWLSTQPPKMSPLPFMSAGIGAERITGSPRSAGDSMAPPPAVSGTVILIPYVGCFQKPRHSILWPPNPSPLNQIGRQPGRERVLQYVKISVVG